jgi:CubicO group peptidase (beta-lactamase class C family)
VSPITGRALGILSLAALLYFVPEASGAQEPLWGGRLVERIDSLAEATLRGGPVAGMTIGVRRGGDVLLLRGYGRADVEQGVQAGAETVYRIGSITKQFTAAAVMQLVDQGRIDLEASVSDYLPDFPLQGHDVRVHHLLTHTSGIVNYTGLGETFWSQSTLDLTHDEMVAIFANEPFDFAPGEDYLYTNSGFYLLGMIVERVSGVPYDEYLDQHVFGPLGMRGSSYCHEDRIIPRRAEGYSQRDGQLVNDAYISMNTPGAAGALCSTAPDLLTWSLALREGRVVSEASYRAMTRSATLVDGTETGYGFGLAIDYSERVTPAYGGSTLPGVSRVAHAGSINGFRVISAYYPDADLDIVVLLNTQTETALALEEHIARWALGVAPAS